MSNILKLNNKIITLSGSVVGYEPPPIKGELINMNLDGSGDKTYRILNIDGTVAECLAMYNVSTNTVWGTTQWTSTYLLQYAENTLDNYLNTTWYGTLNDTAKNAILQKNINQDAWTNDSTGSPIYTGAFGKTTLTTTSYTISNHANETIDIGNRYIYILGIQDIIDYLADESVQIDKTNILQNTNIWKMFWDITSGAIMQLVWLRSAVAKIYSGNVWAVAKDDGSISYLSHEQATITAVRPAFCIDLSKVPFTKTTEVIS